ncbi:MAG TPA: DegT/DnrJ/EryC1/StrS family aminotransferase, partial [Terriglobales bacterium]|nr:DegT/DnrJ/EryC1/StrS family aminotransferase [Terriglobales bacterium]
MNKSSIAKPQGEAQNRGEITQVPLLDLRRQYEGIRDEILPEIERVCASQQFILGSEVEKLESDIAGFIGCREAVGCASGTDALWLALLALGVGPGDLVITTAFSFFASASAIVRAGARPIFVDVDPHTLNIDPVSVQNQLQSGAARKLKVLLPVHLYGQCSDMDSLQALADAFNLLILEDAAQAIGASWRDRRAGSLGNAAAFSFYPTKNLSAYGDAGLVTTSDSELALHMRRLRNHGSLRRYHHEELGWNSRLDSLQAA